MSRERRTGVPGIEGVGNALQNPPLEREKAFDICCGQGNLPQMRELTLTPCLFLLFNPGGSGGHQGVEEAGDSEVSWLRSPQPPFSTTMSAAAVAQAGQASCCGDHIGLRG